MHPDLFRLGPATVPTHEFFVAAGAIAATAVYLALARRRGRLDDRLVWIAIGALATGLVFAKLSTSWRYLAQTPDADLAGLWLHGGRSILGGLAGAYVGAEVTKRIVGYRESTGDLFAPAVALGMAIGRIGCFLAEAPGIPTSLPWGITLGPDAAATLDCTWCVPGATLHPSMLYEAAFHLVAFSVLWRITARRAAAQENPDGAVFKGYLLAYGIVRFGLEFVRGNPEVAFGLSGSQLFLLTTVPLLTAWFVRRRVTASIAPPPPTASAGVRA